MNPSIDCPDVLLLQQFLDGSEFTDASQTWTRDRVEQHVNECESCQRSIERLVAGQETWEGAAQQLAEIEAFRTGSSSDTPALRQLIDQVKDRAPGGLPGETRVGTDVAATELPLDFLQPSDQPDSRGRIGSYEILDVVGRGGMGLVLKAYDLSLRRIVAIKVMAAHLASCPAARKRFVREARAAAAVSHDHVVAIYAVEENHEPPFLAMQFVSGKTLQERLASGPLAVTEILRIGMQTASGLAAAHAQGLVHRDIKPANILLENGVERVKITDFGLARAIDDVGMTQTGVVAGTPQFMAPEQANGEAIDVRSDLFSLGSMLYTLCTGRPPFRATTTMGLLKRICEETPRPIRDLNPDIPEWLDAIIAKLLKKDPVERYQTAKEVAELLAGWLAHVQRPTTVPAPIVTKAASSSPETGRENQPVAEQTVATLPPQVKNASSSWNSAVDSFASPATIDKPTGLLPQMSQLFWGDYSHSLPFNGDATKAFDLAVASLSAPGFTVDQRTETQLSFTGPGLNRLRGNVLAAASSIEVRQNSGNLFLDASLGTLRSLHAFLLGILAITFLLVFVVWPYSSAAAPNPLGLIVLAFFGVLVGSSIVLSRREIRKAFDILLGNLAKTGMVNPAKRPDSADSGSSALATFRQRLKEAYPTSAYWITGIIWGAVIVPMQDSMGSIPFPALHWLAIGYVVLGIGAFAFFNAGWAQTCRMGTLPTHSDIVMAKHVISEMGTGNVPILQIPVSSNSFRNFGKNFGTFPHPYASNNPAVRFRECRLSFLDSKFGRLIRYNCVDPFLLVDFAMQRKYLLRVEFF